MRRTTPAVLLLIGLTAGCAPAGRPAVRAAAEAFQQAVSRSDGTRACQLLADEAKGNLESASRRSCARALPALGLPTGPVRSVAVWGDEAQVRLAMSVLFLARFRDGWKVTGAGCKPRPGMPYDCDVEA